MTASERRQALLDLLRLRRPLAEAVEALKRFPWDSDVELVTLSRLEALELLRMFAEGILTADDCAAWANAVEGRDDVGLEEGAEDALKEFLFEISTPEIAGELTMDGAEKWQWRLG